MSQNLFTNFEAFDIEIERKYYTKTLSPDELMKALLDRIASSSLPSEDHAQIKRLYDEHLTSLFTDKKKTEYLSHPIRVAASYLACLSNPTYEDLSLALCHNFQEATGRDFTQKDKEFLSEKARHRISVMTIDRQRQEDETYLSDYFQGILSEGDDLILLKALDKLDNSFGWPRSKIVGPYHARVITDFLCPLVKSPHPEIEKYLRELTNYVMTSEAKDKFRVTETSS